MLEKMMSILSEYLKDPLWIRIFQSLLLIVILWSLKVLIQKLIDRSKLKLKTRYTWHKVVKYVIFFLILLVVGRIWIKGVQTLATYLGLLSAGIAIALKDIIANFAGWVFIISRRPFEVGDRIQIGNKMGDVIDIRPFEFTLLEIGNWVAADQSTGRLIFIPNGKVFTQELANFDQGFHYIWNEIPVTITFESNWQKAKKILQNIIDKQPDKISKQMESELRRSARKFMIYYSKLTPIVYLEVVDHGVKLTLRYLCEPRRRRNSAQTIWEDVLVEFAKNDDIALAYPTTRFYDHFKEKK